MTDHNAYQLANIADIQSPDQKDSPGAVFLLSVQDAVNEAIEDKYQDMDEAAHEIADNAVPVYTYQMWQTFIDLCAWNEDPSEFGRESEDMSQQAGVCLYLIANRLADTLIEEARSNAE
jgi:hypothetical protein